MARGSTESPSRRSPSERATGSSWERPCSWSKISPAVDGSLCRCDLDRPDRLPGRLVRVHVRGRPAAPARPAGRDPRPRRRSRPPGGRRRRTCPSRRAGRSSASMRWRRSAATSTTRSWSKTTSRRPSTRRIDFRGRAWYVEDLASTNGTFVNGQPGSNGLSVARLRRRAAGRTGPVPVRASAPMTAAAGLGCARSVAMSPDPAAQPPPRVRPARHRGPVVLVLGSVSLGVDPAPAGGPGAQLAAGRRRASWRSTSGRSSRLTWPWSWPAGGRTRSCCRRSACSAGSASC